MNSRHVFTIALAAALMLGGAAPGRACGHCKEDKIAATYDHAVVTAAKRNGQTVVYAELKGPITPGAKLESWIQQQVQACTGVVRGTVRTSLQPAALSFACDVRQTSVSAALRSIGEKLARRGLSVSLIEAQAAPKG